MLAVTLFQDETTYKVKVFTIIYSEDFFYETDNLIYNNKRLIYFTFLKA